MRATACLAVLTACSYHPQPSAGDDAHRPIDAPVDAIDARTIDAGANCFGDDPFLVCLQTIPAGNLTLGTATESTDSCAGEVYAFGTQQVCVLAGIDVDITGAPYRAEGTLPLVVVATHDLTVEPGAYVDVSAGGAGASFAGCTLADGNSDNNGGGGGAGGTFGTAGAAGGNGAGASGAAPVDPVAATLVRGGCAGGRGGNGQGNGGKPGASGGGVYLVAANALTIAGTIDASGAGGGGAPGGKNGGGGGGSGGFIGLYGGASLGVQPGAQLFANGGGGGAGADSSGGGDGGRSNGPDASGNGGNGPAHGGDGATHIAPGATGANGSKGGGGGGGGLGVIENVSGQALSSGAFSPMPI